MHTESDLEELLERIDIETFLDREGRRYRHTHGRSGPQLYVEECPVCGANWKVYLNQATGVGNCFGGSHPPEERIFTKWRFIKACFPEANGRQVYEYVKHVAAEQGWRPKRVTSAAVEQKAIEWKLPPSVPLPFKGRNISYLDNRGITPDYAGYFHLRYAPVGSVFPYKVDEEFHFQDYSRRVLIPVYDLNGKLATFQGRDTTGVAEDKYLFPPGLPGSGTFVYNAFNVRDTKRIVVGEGVFDVAAIKIAFDQEHDLRDVVPVGTFGKHLSSGEGNTQLAVFKMLRERGIEEVTFMWDGEPLAIDAALTACVLLLPYGFRLRVATLPFKKDPNEVAPAIVRKAFYEATAYSNVAAIALRMRYRHGA